MPVLDESGKEWTHFVGMGIPFASIKRPAQFPSRRAGSGFCKYLTYPRLPYIRYVHERFIAFPFEIKDDLS
jgi:hypothetical protein